MWLLSAHHTYVAAVSSMPAKVKGDPHGSLGSVGRVRVGCGVSSWYNTVCEATVTVFQVTERVSCEIMQVTSSA